VGWHVYDCLSEAIGEGQNVRLAYHGKDLEIVTTGYPHERYKEPLGQSLAAVTLALDIDRGTCGETTRRISAVGWSTRTPPADWPESVAWTTGREAWFAGRDPVHPLAEADR